MTRKRQSTKKRTRRRMYGRGGLNSRPLLPRGVGKFLGENVSGSDAVATLLLAVEKAVSYFSPEDMKIYLTALQTTNSTPGTVSQGYLLERLGYLYNKYNTQIKAERERESAARVAEMGPVVRSGLGISADGIPPAPLFSPPAPAPAPVTLPPPPPPLDLAAPPPMPLAPPISPSRSSGGRRRKTRRRGRR